MASKLLFPNKGLGGSMAGDGGAAQKALAAAIAAIRAGGTEEARRLLQAGGGVALKTPVGQNVLGDSYLKEGRAEEALKAFDTAIRYQPAMPEAFANRAAALQALERFDEALAAADRALRLRPGYGMAHFNRGNALKALARHEEAVAAYGKAIGAVPDFADALLNRGLSLIEARRPFDALADFDRVQILRPRDAAALVGRAQACRDLGDLTRAIAAAETARALEPDNIDVAVLKCGLLVLAERPAEALAEADAVLAASPGEVRIVVLRAEALNKLRRYDEALATADAATRLAADDAAAHAIRGVVLAETGRLEESLAAFDRARDLGARGADYFGGRGVALSGWGDLKEALACLDEAVALAPDDANVRYNRAFTMLALGDFENGWREHEWRLKRREHGHADEMALAPAWRGEDLTGKRLLVYAEQGLGDTLQFARFLPAVVARGAETTLLVGGVAEPLLKANFPDVDVTGSLRFRRDFDYQAALMSLPAALALDEAALATGVPYLAADGARIAKWAARLGPGFKVGLVWQGNPGFHRDRDRSIPLRQFAPLAAVPGVRFISLQFHAGTDQLKNPPAGMTIETLGETIENNPDGLREVAAAMANLDLIVTSDTGPAHLAGALGRPTWVALAYRPDWRWLQGRSDSPWYPTMRLFRQKTRGDWPGVFADIADALGAAVAAQGAKG